MSAISKMALQLSSFLLLLQFLFYTVGAEKPTEITISTTKTDCPFNVTFQINKDLSAIEVEYASQGGALVRVGDGQSEVASRYECLAWMQYGYQGLNISMNIPSADVKSTVSLGEGVVAKVETSVFWRQDARPVRLPT
jgi:hypothetical protein